MYEKILVPLDGSSASEIVLPYAEEIASKLATEIILVSVSEIVAAGADQL
jgi:nucleotide-binding universal stress UspA family protein